MWSSLSQDSVRILLGTDMETAYSLGGLLPMRFRPQDVLGDAPGPLLMEPQHNMLTFTSAAAAVLKTRSDDRHFLSASDAALKAAIKVRKSLFAMFF